MDKLWYIIQRGYYSAVKMYNFYTNKMYESQNHNSEQMKSGKNSTYCMNPFIQSAKMVEQIHGLKRWNE